MEKNSGCVLGVLYFIIGIAISNRNSKHDAEE